MKKKSIFQISAFLIAAVFITSCAEWEEFESLDLSSAPTVTVVQSNVSDSTLTVDVTSTAAGFVAAILMEGTGNTVPEDPEALLTGDVTYLAYSYKEVKASEAVKIKFSSDIIQNSKYEVMAVAANPDGVVSKVEVVEVTTTDSYAPGLVSVDPSFTYDPVVNIVDTIIMTFDEPVALGDGSFTFVTFYEGQSAVVPAANLSVSGNSVSIIIPFTPTYGDYLWLSWEAGAVEDLSGNGVDALTTALDGGSFVGAYWRIVKTDMDFKTAMPDQSMVYDPGFDLTFTYDSAVSFATSSGVPVIEDGDITLTYVDSESGNKLIVGVPVADITIDEMDLVIAQSDAPVWFGTVTVDIPEGLFTVGHGNPMVEVSETWNTKGEHPLEAWIGTYSVDAVSYGDPGTWDEAWTVTTSPVSGDDTKLSMVGFGLDGPTPVIATLDKDAMTISIEPGQDCDAYEFYYGYTESYIYFGNADLSLDKTASVVGTISEDGTISIDNFGIGLEYQGTDYGTWDVFNTTWTKGGKKSVPVSNYVDKAKFNRK